MTSIEIPWSVALNFIADAIIIAVYFIVPFIVLTIDRHKRIEPLHSVAMICVLFMVCCNIIHLIDVFCYYDNIKPAYVMVKLTASCVALLALSMVYQYWPAIMKLKTVDDFEKEIKARESVEHELRRSNADLEQFAYAASHDLHEPLRKVTSFCKLIKERYGKDLDATGIEFIDYAIASAEQMRGLIDHLLDYARLNTKPTLELVNLISPLARAMSMLSEVIVDSKAAITCERLPTVKCDVMRMALVFQNLIANAIKFKRPGMFPVINIATRQIEHEWVIMIEDDGIGIDPKYHQRIFEPFKRVHSRSLYQGSGVGLSICQRIIEQHRGRIWVESDCTGSKFSFTLPKETGND